MLVQTRAGTRTNIHQNPRTAARENEHRHTGARKSTRKRIGARTGMHVSTHGHAHTGAHGCARLYIISNYKLLRVRRVQNYTSFLTRHIAWLQPRANRF